MEGWFSAESCKSKRWMEIKAKRERGKSMDTDKWRDGAQPWPLLTEVLMFERELRGMATFSRFNIRRKQMLNLIWTSHARIHSHSVSVTHTPIELSARQNGRQYLKSKGVWTNVYVESVKWRSLMIMCSITSHLQGRLSWPHVYWLDIKEAPLHRPIYS